jgi:iron complex transport system substrate-binding protein
MYAVYAHLTRQWRLLLVGFAILGLTIGSGLAAAQQPVPARDASRIVSVGGTVTEIVYRLGAGEQVVGVDTSSLYPEAATQLPQVGYQRTLSVEGVLSLAPTLILATDEAGPPDAVALLRSAGVPLVPVPSSPHSVAGAQQKIRLIAQTLRRERAGEALLAEMQRDIDTLHAMLARLPSRPGVMFIYARGAGAMSVSGSHTAAAAMIELAGGTNAVQDYSGYKPLTPEAVVAAAPEYILIPEHGLESVGGIDGLLSVPGIEFTPAGKSRQIVAMNDLYLLGFGPRLGKALQDLAGHLHALPQSGKP